MATHKTYLGDAVYAECDGWNIWLTTEDGPRGEVTNRICLEPEVLANLFQYRNQQINRLLSLPEEQNHG